MNLPRKELVPRKSNPLTHATATVVEVRNHLQNAAAESLINYCGKKGHRAKVYLSKARDQGHPQKQRKPTHQVNEVEEEATEPGINQQCTSPGRTGKQLCGCSKWKLTQEQPYPSSVSTLTILLIGCI